ncbi:flagellar hook-basal body complex protein FliE [Anaerobacillus arseniciselenatis]|uniref:Flagellar hook-basal body complex protein FliE n=1 Tax=Anaerobacillus arseniciselenatis TaxID=85682 RepID=A0A1S2LBM1_9BACI|nr:flagellar hook-basal body complex protein FliE [Anaerobacillus arseniciselenatis]OIJ09898.1 flagellar hook-basal body complex protein FliE [Anaerobacillus arseniciselenatis]
MDPIAYRPNSVMNIQGATQPTRKLSSAEAQNNFKSLLSDALHNVNNAQHASAKATEKLARGENIDLHEVMITGQKASITLQTTVEVRNKIVEAYQEVMRMQV